MPVPGLQEPDEFTLGHQRLGILVHSFGVVAHSSSVPPHVNVVYRSDPAYRPDLAACRRQRQVGARERTLAVAASIVDGDS